MDKISFANIYLPTIKEFLGMEIENLSTDDSVDLEITNLSPIIKQLNEAYLNELIRPFEEILEECFELYKEHGNLHLYRNVIIERYVEKYINLNIENDLLFNFIDKLKFLSTCTYEQNQTNISCILFSNESLNIQDELCKLNIDYLPFPSSLTVTDIIHDKLTYKIIDSLSTSLVINNSLEIVGIAKKKKNRISINEIMTNRYKYIQELHLKNNIHNYFLRQLDLSAKNAAVINDLQQQFIKILNLPNDTHFNDLKADLATKSLKKMSTEKREKARMLLTTIILLSEDILNGMNYSKQNQSLLEEASQESPNKDIHFIQLNNGAIYWYINDNNILSFKTNGWSLRNYDLISNVLSEFIVRQFASKLPAESLTGKYIIDTLEKVVPNSIDLFNKIKNLSNKNIGALIIILKDSKQRYKTIFKNLTSSKKMNDTNYHILVRSSSTSYTSLKSCDKYLFELLCSVDGALILNKNFNILSYGELINNSNSQRTDEIQRGSRTLAAYNASNFGLSIKVSEDGDITVFEHENIIYKL